MNIFSKYVYIKIYQLKLIINLFQILILQKFFGIVRQAGCQNDHPTFPTFLQLLGVQKSSEL